ncbi:MAG TPA: hypothetical protein PK611_01615 [Saprospiraceae bacterium]|nr:hypothetical protein [Saprospiraceae bacterium]HRO08074.1 hypothetical protein [Saprospiraceae bacterium]HRO72346.1 hypothetical protein [Saprospiraceae bacterium]HRP41339.1 hypothetical protein [Saprospiraceae bacterium]
MSSVQKAQNYILGFAIIGMGVFSWIYDQDLVPNGKILSVLFVIYGSWRLYRGYKSQ